MKSSANQGERILPEHLAIIMDGNDRWANVLCPVLWGIEQALLSLKPLPAIAVKIGIKYFNGICFSTEKLEASRRRSGRFNGVV